MLQRSAGNLERAVACYRAALQLRPAFAQALNNLAVVLTAQAGAPARPPGALPRGTGLPPASRSTHPW